MRRKHWMGMVALAVLGLIAVGAPADVMTFQNGVAGYTGSDDAWLNYHTPPVQSRVEEQWRPPIRFDRQPEVGKEIEPLSRFVSI